MNEQKTQLPSVYNLTTEKKRFDGDMKLVENELFELMKPDWKLPADDEVVGMAPRGRPEHEERLRKDLQTDMKGRLEKLKLVLLMDRWLLPSDGVIAEALGVYISDIRSHWSGIKIELGRDVDPTVLAQIDKVCDDATKPDDFVPTVILLMEGIEVASKRPEWKERFKSGDHGWLTTKVLHHELGHHVFPVDARKYVRDDSRCHLTMRAEAGANWYSWLIGSPEQRDLLKAFTDSDAQTEPYRSYRKLIEWAKSEPFAPGASVATSALNQNFGTVIDELVYDANSMVRLEESFADMPWLTSDSLFTASIASGKARQQALAALASITASKA